MSDDTDEAANLREAFIMLGGAASGFANCHECGELQVMRWHEQLHAVLLHFTPKNVRYRDTVYVVAVTCGEACAILRMDTIRKLDDNDLKRMFSAPSTSRVSTSRKRVSYSDRFSRMSLLEDALQESVAKRRASMKSSFNLREPVPESWTKR